MSNFCDLQKIEAIKEEINLQEIIENPEYRNPCKNYMIPYYLAYIYFYYLKDTQSASHYYKVVSAQDDAPQGARGLAAIMQRRAGDREKSIFMFLSLAKSVAEENESCIAITSNLENYYAQIVLQNIPLN